MFTSKAIKYLRLTLVSVALVLFAQLGDAAEYYIGPNGDYADYDAFQIAVPTPVAGDDVYFECGETWIVDANTKNIDVTWSGVNASNYAVIGAYYESGGHVNSQDAGFNPALCTKPKLDGTAWVQRNAGDGTTTVFNFTDRVYDSNLLDFAYIGSDKYKKFYTDAIYDCASGSWPICATWNVNADQDLDPGGDLTITFNGSPLGTGRWINFAHQGYPYDAGGYVGMVDVDTQDYVIVEYIHVKGSGGYAAYFDYCSNSIAQYITSEVTMKSAIQFNHTGTNNYIQDCDVTQFAATWPHVTVDINSVLIDDWGYGVGFISSNSDGFVLRNIVYQGWGEGIGVYYNADRHTIENNIVYATQSTGIYVSDSCCHNIGYNLVFGTTDTYYHTRGMDYTIEGIKVTHECHPSRQNSTYTIEETNIYNNITAFLGLGIKRGTGGCAPYSNQSDAYTVNNLSIDNILSQVQFEGTSYTNMLVQNNIFMSTGTDPLLGGYGSAGVSWLRNHWQSTTRSTPEYSQAIDAANDSTGAGILTNESAFDNILLTLPTVADAVPVAASAIVDTAAPISGYNSRFSHDSVLPDSVTKVFSYTDTGWERGPVELSGVVANSILPKSSIVFSNDGSKGQASDVGMIGGEN